MEKTSEKNPEKDIFLRGIYPLALFARFFGYFPLSNLGHRVYSAENLRGGKCSWDVVFTALFLSIMAHNNWVYMHVWPSLFGTRFNTNLHNGYSLVYRINSVVIFIYFAVIQNKKVIQLIQRTCAVENPHFLNHSRDVNLLGITLTIFCFVFCGIYLICMHYFSNFGNPFVHISYITGAVVVMFTYNFITAFIIFFSLVLSYHFQDLANELSILITSSQASAQTPIHLAHVRYRHEILASLVDELNDILSPVLLLYIVSQVLGSAFNFYGACDNVINQDPIDIMIRTITFALLRFVPLVLVCLTSTNLTEKAKLGFKIFNRKLFVNLNRQSEFQVYMLNLQLKDRKPQLTAGNIVNINKRLIAEVAGMTLTYTIVMIQLRADC